jgi:ATP-dependent Clp protease ATP-binding subunit ClpC
MKSRIMGELKRVFRPELLNRIDEVIVFHKLSKEEIGSIVELLMKRLREQMKEHEVSIELTSNAVDLLADKGYDPVMGARPLRRAIQNLIEDPLADYVLSRSLPAGGTIVVDRKEGSDEVDISVVEGPPASDKEPAVVGTGAPAELESGEDGGE